MSLNLIKKDKNEKKNKKSLVHNKNIIPPAVQPIITSETIQRYQDIFQKRKKFKGVQKIINPSLNLKIHKT